MKTKIIIALIGIIPAILTAILGYMGGIQNQEIQKAKSELQSKRITFQQSENPNYKELLYPNYGISLIAPVEWTTEDAPARLAGGEFNLVHRYEETKGVIGINFRLRPVQPNYINDIATQIHNQKVTFEKNYRNLEIQDATISGAQAKLFIYEVPTGNRRILVKQYWIRVVPTVQLQIIAAQYKDARDFDDFWQKSERVIDSIVIAFDSWQERYKKNAQ